MFPGIGMSPKNIVGMMKKLGINQSEIEADRVIIEKKDMGRIVIENPSVQKISMQGQTSFQVSGEVSEEEIEGIREEDVKLVVEKTGKSKNDVKKALESAGGDIAEAIVKLSG